MKCENCGAEISIDSQFCGNCGAPTSTEQREEQEKNNKMHCPNCNGTNIQFKRENHGEVRGKDSKHIIHKTIGLCKDCGATWEVVYEKPKKPKKSKKPLTEKQKKRRKIFWGIFIFLCLLITVVSCGSKDNEVANIDIVEETITETENSSTENIIIEEDNDSEEDVFSTWTAEQRYAFTSGLTYLEVMAFSRQGLIDQLSSEYGENYPLEVAEFAVNAIEEQGLVDWDAECEEAAQTYLSLMSFSKQGLIDQLSSEYGEQFTVEQAERAVEKVYK